MTYYLTLSYRQHQPGPTFIRDSDHTVSIYLLSCCLACPCCNSPLPWSALNLWFWFKRITLLIITTVHPCNRPPYKAHHCWKQKLPGGVERTLTRMRVDTKASSNSNSVRSNLASLSSSQILKYAPMTMCKIRNNAHFHEFSKFYSLSRLTPKQVLLLNSF